MLPETNLASLPETLKSAQVIRAPSYGYKLENGRILGTVDGAEAVRQAIYMILSTERYMYPIYPWSYGFERLDLYGLNPRLVEPKLQQRIFDALYQDDRITNITDFKVVNDKGVYTVSFTVSTIFGDDLDMEVSV